MLKVMKLVTRLLFAAAIAAFIAGLVLSFSAAREGAHDPEDIGIRITAMRTERRRESPYTYDGYFAYFDFTIVNGTEAEINYITVTTWFEDAAGKRIGSINSQFGGYYSDTLGLKAGEGVTLESYISSYTALGDSLAEALYGTRLSDYSLTYSVGTVVFADGYSVYP